MSTRRVEVLLVALGYVLLLVATTHEIRSDGAYRYENLQALLEHGSWTPVRGIGAGFSLVGPLFATPLYWLGYLIEGPVWTVSLFNVLLFGLMLAWLARRAASPVVLRFMLLLVAASMFPYHLTQFYGEVFSALGVALGLYLVTHGRPTLGWMPMLLACVNTPALLAPLALLCLVVGVQGRRWHAVWPVVAAGALYAGESWLRRGGLFSTYYWEQQHPQTVMPYSGLTGFSYPFFFGVLNILFSFGKGLVFFTPGLFLALPPGVDAKIRRTYQLALVFIVGMVLVYAKWWAWSGDWFWGPRFFLFASFVSCGVLAARALAPAGTWRDDVLTLGALALSVWVAVDGLVFQTKSMGLCTDDDGKLGVLCQSTLEYSALWRPFVVQPALSTRAYALLAYHALVAVVVCAPIAKRLATRAYSKVGRA